MPTYRSLVEETDAMLKKQRQKGVDYKFRDGPGRPAPLDNNFAPAPAAAEGAPAAKAGEAAQPASLDDYDPKEQADREREALIATVSAMRSEASKLTVDVGDLQRRYETAKIDLAQLAYEDDVDHERAAGLRKMSEVRRAGEQGARARACRLARTPLSRPSLAPPSSFIRALRANAAQDAHGGARAEPGGGGADAEHAGAHAQAQPGREAGAPRDAQGL